MRTVILFLILLLTSNSFAKVPAKLKKSAGYNSARSLLKHCNSEDDALQCPKGHGAECSLIVDDTKEQYRCVTEISIDFTKARASSRPPDAVQKYEVVYLLSKTEKGWSGKTKKVIMLDE